MSHTMVTAPIVASVVKAEDMLGEDRLWTPSNDEQACFLADFFSRREELEDFSEEELRSWASWVAYELNKILKDEGFSIRLDDFAEGEFGVVSILDVLVQWLGKGVETEILRAGSDMMFPAVKMEPSGEIGGDVKTLFESFVSSSHEHPIALVHTQSEDRLFMTIADGPREDFDLMARIDQIRSTLRTGSHYDWLLFPMIDLDQEVDIGWLRGMSTQSDDGQRQEISQAKQQTKFKMNQFGARVKSAVAIAIQVISIQVEQGLEIDQPFFLWIERDGLSTPVMYAYFEESDWSDPGDLSDM